jgi:pimeloyl-ACP methyl ester carboxylesterase
LRLLDRAHITSATLVGHSYAGMVIAAAADRAGGRVSRLVHLDAYVPRDGESCWSSTNEHFREVFAVGAEFVYCSGWEDRTPFAELHTRLQADPEWQVHDLPTGHDAMHESPSAVAALLLGERIPECCPETLSH